jgi:hypothetical protein
MPDTVDFQFREAIAARTQLANSFEERVLRKPLTKTPSTTSTSLKSKSKSTSIRAADNRRAGRSLTKIYTDLCECCRKPKENCKLASLSSPFHGNKRTLANRFTALDFGSVDGDYLPTAKSTDGQCDQCARETSITITQESPTPQLVGDHLDDIFEIQKEVQVYLIAHPGMF